MLIPPYKKDGGGYTSVKGVRNGAIYYCLVFSPSTLISRPTAKSAGGRTADSLTCHYCANMGCMFGLIMIMASLESNVGNKMFIQNLLFHEGSNINIEKKQ